MHRNFNDKKSQISLEINFDNKFSIPNKMIKSIEGYSYKVNQWIGKGYSSTVHKGKKDSTGQDVSLKVIQMTKLQDSINEMLLQYEITALKALASSSHVLHLYDAYGTKNNTYIITELMQGDLHTLLKKKKQFPYYEAVQVIRQIINGYYDVYKSGYLHRDIKPANIFYKKDTYKIGDFGFAIPIIDARNHRHYNVGSPVYMPPEALKENIYTPTCDIWAIGIIFYQLLKGLAPWRAVSEQKLYDKIMNQPLNQLTLGLPEIARVFLDRALNLDQTKRMSPQELITWPQKLFAVQIRGTSQQKAMIQKVPLQQVPMNNLNLENPPPFYSRSKSYSSSQVPNYVSGLRINLNNCQINGYQTQNNQQKMQTKTLLVPPSSNRNYVSTLNYQSTKKPQLNWQKTSTFITTSTVNPNQIQLQKCKNQQDTQFYASNMINYIKFIHRVIKFISHPTQIQLKDLQLSLIRFLFKQIETIKRFMEPQNFGNFDQISGWRQFFNSSDFEKKFKEPFNFILKKYRMFHVLPKDEFVLEIYRQQILDGIQKIYSYFENGNHSDKSLVSLDYLVSFYQVWDYREKKGTNFNFKEFLEYSRFDNIMSCSPYEVKKQHFAQLKNKMANLCLLGQQKILSQISVGFRSNIAKNKELTFNNKENVLRVPMRY